MTKAIGILSWSGGLSGFAMTGDCYPAGTFDAAVCAKAVKGLLANAASAPNIAELVSNSLLFMFILSFLLFAALLGDREA